MIASTASTPPGSCRRDLVAAPGCAAGRRAARRQRSEQVLEVVAADRDPRHLVVGRSPALDDGEVPRLVADELEAAPLGDAGMLTEQIVDVVGDRADRW